MTLREFCRTGIFKEDHSTFGGEIYPSDFETDYRGKDNTNGSFIARRIESDFRFDKECMKNNINRKLKLQTQEV